LFFGLSLGNFKCNVAYRMLKAARGKHIGKRLDKPAENEAEHFLACPIAARRSICAISARCRSTPHAVYSAYMENENPTVISPHVFRKHRMIIKGLNESCVCLMPKSSDVHWMPFPYKGKTTVVTARQCKSARRLVRARRRNFLQIRPLGPALHPGSMKAGAQRAHYRWHRGRQSLPVIHTWSYKLGKAA
jgi:hypothetical protein